MVTRSGHSLPELLVALAFSATAMTGIAAMALTAHRVTTRADRQLVGASAAASVLDSLLSSPEVAPGERQGPDGQVEWTVRPEGRGRLVRVRSVPRGSGPGVDTAGAVVLEGFWAPPAITAPPEAPSPGPTGAAPAGGLP